MVIRVYREAQTGDWITTIPIHHRDDFRFFASEMRLPCTFATLLIQNGEPIAYVQEQLGDSSIKLTVDTYTPWMPGSAAKKRPTTFGSLGVRTSGTPASTHGSLSIRRL
jgi:hypothetical protein